MKALKYVLVVFTLLFKGFLYEANALKIVVRDTKTEAPIEGASIFRINNHKNLKLLGITNREGSLNLDFPGPDSPEILVRADGYFEYRFSPQMLANTTSICFLNSITKGLNEHVVTGQIGQNSTGQSVFPVKVIESRRFKLQGANNLNELLTNDLNVRLSQDAQLGSSLTLRGMAGQNVKILMDGVPLIGRQDGNLDLSQFNLSNVDRIEIIEGPMAVNYGTDAMGGVINIITKNGAGFGSSMRLKSYYESVGTYNFDASGSFRIKKSQLQLNAGRYFFGGWDPSGNDVRNKLWKPRTQQFLDLQWNLPLGTRWNFRQTCNLWQQKISIKGSPTITPYEAYAFDTYIFGKRLNYSGFFNYKSQNGNDAQIIYGISYYGQYRNKYYKNLVNLEEARTTAKGDQDSIHFYQFMSRGQYQIKPLSNKIRAQFGYDIQSEFNQGSLIKNKSQQLNSLAAFSNVEFQPSPHFTLRAGGRFTHNSRFGNPFTPSLHVLYQPNSKLSFRASWAQGFRAPSLKEMYLDFVDVNHNIHGNENLNPEKGQNIQSQAGYSFSIGKMKGKFELSAYYSKVNQLISRVLLDAVTQNYVYQNIDQFQSQGAQIQSELKSKALTLALGFAFNGRKSTLTGTATPYLYSPEISGRITAEILKTKTWISLFYKYNGILQGYAFDNSGQLVLNKLSAYQWMDCSASRNFLNEKLSLILGAKNIFNVKTIAGSLQTGAHSGNATQTNTGYGRTFFITLVWNM